MFARPPTTQSQSSEEVAAQQSTSLILDNNSYKKHSEGSGSQPSYNNLMGKKNSSIIGARNSNSGISKPVRAMQSSINGDRLPSNENKQSKLQPFNYNPGPSMP